MSLGNAAQRRADQSAKVDVTSSGIESTHAKKRKLPDKRWSFGFRFFREITNFGLDSDLIEKKWMISMLARLTDLSHLTLASVLEDKVVRDGILRIHDINWEQKNIPFKRDDLDWIDDKFLKNDAEYPLFQLAVSKANGRLVGFLDDESVYQIVLLDPLHNAQPTKFNDYKVRLCKPLGCEVTALKVSVKALVDKITPRSCSCGEELEAAMTWEKRTNGQAIVMPIVEGNAVDDADELIASGLANSYVDIFEAGLLAILERST